jgi:hypothetical protein
VIGAMRRAAPRALFARAQRRRVDDALGQVAF